MILISYTIFWVVCQPVFGDDEFRSNDEIVKIKEDTKDQAQPSSIDNMEMYNKLSELLSKYSESSHELNKKLLKNIGLVLKGFQDHSDVKLNTSVAVIDTDKQKVLNLDSRHIPELIERNLVMNNTLPRSELLDIAFKPFYEMKIKQTKCCNQTVDKVKGQLTRQYKRYTKSIVICDTNEDGDDTNEDAAATLTEQHFFGTYRGRIPAVFKPITYNQAVHSNRSNSHDIKRTFATLSRCKQIAVKTFLDFVDQWLQTEMKDMMLSCIKYSTSLLDSCERVDTEEVINESVPNGPPFLQDTNAKSKKILVLLKRVRDKNHKRVIDKLDDNYQVINKLSKYQMAQPLHEIGTTPYETPEMDHKNTYLENTETLEHDQQKLSSTSEILKDIEKLMITSKRVSLLDIKKILLKQFDLIQLNPSECCKEIVNNVSALIEFNFKTYSNEDKACLFKAADKTSKDNRRVKKQRACRHKKTSTKNSNMKPKFFQANWRTNDRQEHSDNCVLNDNLNQCQQAVNHHFLAFVKQLLLRSMGLIKLSCDKRLQSTEVLCGNFIF